MADEYREQLSLDVGKFLAGLKEAKAGLTDMVSQSKSSIEKLAKSFDDMVSSVVEVGKAIAVLTAIPAAITAISQAAGEHAEELADLEIQTGISTQQLQSWSVALRRVGMDTGDLAFMMRVLSANVVEARDQSTNAARMFNALGISQQTLASGNINGILQEMAQRFSQIENGTDKSRIAVELLGRNGLQVLPLFESNLKSAAEESKRFGKLTEDQIAQLAEMDDAFDDLGTAIKKGSDAFGAQFAPAINASVHALTDLVVLIKDLATGTLGELLAGMANYISAAFVSMVGVLKEAIAYVKLTREEYLKEVQKIDEETRNRIHAIFHPNGAGSNAGREKVTAPEDPSSARDAAVKALEAQYKLRQAKAQVGEQILADTAAHEKTTLDRRVADREVFGAEIVEIEANIKLKELDGKINLVKQLQAIDQQYHDSRVAIGFKDAEEQKAFETDFVTLKLNREKQLSALENQFDRDRFAKRTAVIKAIDKEEEDSGKRKVENAKSDYDVRRAIMLRELQDRVSLAQAEVDVADAEFATYEDQAARRYNLQQAQMQLELAQHEDNEQQKEAITRKYSELMAREERRISDGFLQGILEGIHQYTTQLSSMFGLAVDMARQTAQQMQQSFRTIFLDFFEGKIRSLKDVMKEFSNFVKQLMAQILAQLATMLIMRSIVAGMGGGSGFGVNVLSGMMQPTAANAGGRIQRFALGGPVFSNGDSVPALLTPGEFVVSRKGVDALNRINQGQVPFQKDGDVTVNVVGSENRDKPDVSVRRSLEGMVIDIIWKNVRENGSLRGLFQGGAA